MQILYRKGRAVANAGELLYNDQCYYCWKFGHCEPSGLEKSLETGRMRETKYPHSRLYTILAQVPSIIEFNYVADLF